MLIKKILDGGIAIRTPAKVNLFLEVLGKRADGYHDIESVICPVDLFDDLTFTPNGSGRIELLLGDSQGGTLGGQTSAPHLQDPAWNIPGDDSNLVIRALKAVRAELGCTAGCRVELRKNIPAAAGLGGGSSDAAAAIVAALVAWSSWDRDLATRVAARIGSDVPVFLGDRRNGIGLALVTGRGEQIEMLPTRPPLRFVISHPPVGSSTAEVYELWRAGKQIRNSDGLITACAQASVPDSNEPRHAHLPVATLSGSRLLSNDTQLTGNRAEGSADASGATSTLDNEEAQDKVDLFANIGESLFNALQSPASQLTDWIARQLDMFAAAGQRFSLMSGSGSACFSLVTSSNEGRVLVEKLIAFGLPRAYSVQAWYAPSIEQQLESIETSCP